MNVWNKTMKARAKALVFKPSPPALPNLAAPAVTHFSTSDAVGAALCPTAGNREGAAGLQAEATGTDFPLGLGSL